MNALFTVYNDGYGVGLSFVVGAHDKNDTREENHHKMNESPENSDGFEPGDRVEMASRELAYVLGLSSSIGTVESLSDNFYAFKVGVRLDDGTVLRFRPSELRHYYTLQPMRTIS